MHHTSVLGFECALIKALMRYVFCPFLEVLNVIFTATTVSLSGRYMSAD